MKTLTKQIKSIMIVSCALVFLAHGQSIERQVIASSGNTISNSTVQLDFTLGEMIVGDVSNSNMMLNQGFHQGTIQVAITINPIVYLKGPLSGSLMNDDLRVKNYLPTTSPYSDNLTCNSSVFNTGGTSGSGLDNDNIVDWMWVELRDANNNTTAISSRSGLLQRDGDIVDIDGVSDLTFNVPSGDYFIVIKHRNHLGVMTDNTVSLNEVLTIVDFTDVNTPITFGTNAQAITVGTNNVFAMWSGDTSQDGKLNYLGANSDVSPVRSQVFGDPDNSVFGGPPVANYLSKGYFASDVNMDGFTAYLGVLSDVLDIRNNIFSHPSNSVFGGPPVATYIFTQQLPEGGN